MKIALVGRFGEGEILSGPERVARELYYELKSKNEKVVFIEYIFSGYRNSSIVKKIFGNQLLNDNVKRLGILPLIFFLIKEKFDLIHVVNLQRFILSLIPLKLFLSCKIVTTFHGLMKNEIPQRNYYKKKYFLDTLLEQLLVKKSDLLIFPSYLLLQQFQKNYHLQKEKIRVIPNGVSKSFFEIERQFPTIEKSIKLVFYKGLDKSINRGLNELLSRLENIKCETELYVIGDQQVVSHSSKIKIIYQSTMNHSQLITFLADKHFVIKSGKFDSFSIFVLECMYVGLIPIVSDNIGIKDFIENKVNGFIYESNSKRELADLINEIAEDKYNLNSISANARENSRKFEWGKITDDYISAYKSVL